MHALIATLSQQEIAFIAGRDYGEDVDKHTEALNALIFSRNGVFHQDDVWFPYEVIELCSYSLQRGHEREFTICCLLVYAAIEQGFDRVHTIEEKKAFVETFLETLPDDLAEVLANVYGISGDTT